MEKVVPYIGTWIETLTGAAFSISAGKSYLIQVRGLKPSGTNKTTVPFVVPYIGTWIETKTHRTYPCRRRVVPYIGTWIETYIIDIQMITKTSYLIQVRGLKRLQANKLSPLTKSYLIQVRGLKRQLGNEYHFYLRRTLYRYVD